jgi:hypothetical protein
VYYSNNRFTESIPDQLFTYYIENPLMIISINSGSWGQVMVTRLVIDFGELLKVVLKKRGGKKGRGEGVWGLLGFVALVNKKGQKE